MKIFFLIFPIITIAALLSGNTQAETCTVKMDDRSATPLLLKRPEDGTFEICYFRTEAGIGKQKHAKIKISARSLQKDYWEHPDPVYWTVNASWAPDISARNKTPLRTVYFFGNETFSLPLKKTSGVYLFEVYIDYTSKVTIEISSHKNEQ
ncbi:MAG TPA: hypothetical protein VFM02_02705 [Candidatus Paceibacterota bacterium]|nr:hypothetical protein [Candidatus Paceibacterota bacterium]